MADAERRADSPDDRRQSRTGVGDGAGGDSGAG
jgi:hypothetical protein